MILARGVTTLVLLHRRQLVDQWRERLQPFLSVKDGDIGTIGGGKRKPTGRIDIALIQSLVRSGEVSDLVADYGHLIVDECHRLSAVSFELVAHADWHVSDMTNQGALCLGIVVYGSPQGRPSPDHLHAVRAGTLPGGCEIAGRDPVVQPQGPPARDRISA